MLRKSRVFALGVVAVVALRLLSEVPGQLRAQHLTRRKHQLTQSAEVVFPRGVVVVQVETI